MQGIRPRNDAFELWCWRNLLRVPWTARRSSRSILKEISPGCSLEGLMLKLKLQYFGHIMQRTDSFEKTLMLGKIEGGRRRGWQRMRWLDGITDPMDMSLSKLGVGDGQGGLVSCSPWGHKELDTTEQLNWIELRRIVGRSDRKIICAKLRRALNIRLRNLSSVWCITKLHTHLTIGIRWGTFYYQKHAFTRQIHLELNSSGVLELRC